MADQEIKLLIYKDGVPCRVNKDTLKKIGIGGGANFFQGKDFVNLSDEYSKGNQGVNVLINRPDDELALMANGGTLVDFPKTINVPYSVQNIVNFCTLNGFINKMAVFERVSGNVFNIPFVSIGAVVPDAVLVPEIMPGSRHFGGHHTAFRFVGKYAQNVLFKGSMKGYLRISKDRTQISYYQSGNTGITPPSIWLQLTTAYGNNRAENTNRVVLGLDQGGWNGRMTKMDGRGVYAMPLPDYDTLVKEMKDIPAIEFDTYDGSLLGNDPSPHWGQSSEGHQITDWIDIGTETAILLQAIGGKTTFGRLQWLTEDGSIRYDVQQGGGGGTDMNKVIFCPPEAVAFRLFFGGAPVTGMIIKPLPERFDPFRGVWMEFDIDVNLRYQLQPNVEYGFTFTMFDGSYTGYDPNGFIIVNSNIGFETNVRHELTEIINKNLVG